MAAEYSFTTPIASQIFTDIDPRNPAGNIYLSVDSIQNVESVSSGRFMETSAICVAPTKDGNILTENVITNHPFIGLI